MESATITKVRTDLAKAVRDFSEAKCIYKINRLEYPFDKSKLDHLREDVNQKQKLVQNLRHELETYQLEFFFGA